jgi:UDP-glucose 4-epimerase
MRILVTGGAGFIGSHTVDGLVERSHEVAVLDDLSSGKRGRLNPRARFHQADLRDAKRVAEVLEQERPEAIYHLAAQMDVRRSVADPAFDAGVNLVGMLNLMEAARGKGLRRLIFASSGGAIYGEQNVLPCDEDHPCHPVSPYGVAKLATEHYLFFYRNEYGIGSTALRYANVYGPRQDPHGEAGVVAIFCGRLLRDESCTIYGDGGQTRDYVYVGDVAAANIAALEHQVDGAFNIGTGIETDVNRLYAELAELAGVRKEPVYAAARPGEQRRSVISPARADLRLHWQPKISLREGLAATFEYFKSGAPPGGTRWNSVSQ